MLRGLALILVVCLLALSGARPNFTSAGAPEARALSAVVDQAPLPEPSRGFRLEPQQLPGLLGFEPPPEEQLRFSYSPRRPPPLPIPARPRRHLPRLGDAPPG